MKTFIWLPLILLAIQCAAQTKVILDTDIDSDVDDVQALAMLHAYQKMGKVDLIGVIATSSDIFSYQCVDAINTFYDKSDIPIGFLKQQKNLDNFSKYTRQVSEEFPHSITTIDQTIEAAQLYRKLLSESMDNSVVIVTIGHLTSLQNLLKSEGDKISSLTGKELVNKKVKKWLCMGGTYPMGLEANFYRPDPESTVYCLANWQKEVVFCGWELGNQIITGGEYLKSKLNTSNPVYRSYELYNNFAGRPAWDQAAVMLLDNDTASRFFNINTNGYVSVNKDGSNEWHSGKSQKDKKHAYITIKKNIAPESIAKTMDELILELHSN
ncbi:nucleoside hydrolase [Arenibacter sp. TNZ]|jgi:inosine-uridine nucleoside N-ribohydrolase|uniref:nucleoside hydrolase n=1 Tax=Arenibacter TaxID=178469 RepID=UPI000CD3F1C9|nr:MULTISPECIES: nucleoside hydrolase [Arenibacter]MCM4172294.1 nucleoside hydrolase [Arenibacter sp. TNZ]